MGIARTPQHSGTVLPPFRNGDLIKHNTTIMRYTAPLPAILYYGYN